MKIIFAILLPTLSQTIHCDEGLKLRENTSECWNRNLLKKFDSKTPRTALASLPGKYLKITNKGLVSLEQILYASHYKPRFDLRQNHFILI